MNTKQRAYPNVNHISSNFHPLFLQYPQFYSFDPTEQNIESRSKFKTRKHIFEGKLYPKQFLKRSHLTDFLILALWGVEVVLHSNFCCCILSQILMDHDKLIILQHSYNMATDQLNLI